MIFNVHAPNFENTANLLKKVNEEFRGMLLDSQYITAFYLIYNNEKKTLKFTNAGHTKAFYHRYTTDKILALDTDGYFLGISDKTYYEEKQIRVEKNDRIFLYTDGITEIKNSEKEEYGDLRLTKFIKNFKDADSNQFCKTLLEEVNNFTALDNRDDDIAFISVKF
jgi:phosphoserine phosphatase RsbU/P